MTEDETKDLVAQEIRDSLYSYIGEKNDRSLIANIRRGVEQILARYQDEGYFLNLTIDINHREQKARLLKKMRVFEDVGDIANPNYLDLVQSLQIVDQKIQNLDPSQIVVGFIEEE